MGFADKKGITLASGFKLQAKTLLDARECVDTIADRDELVTLNAVTEGLKVYVKADKKTYTWDGTAWISGNAADQTAAFTQAATLGNISTGEKIGVMLGKIAKAIADFISHKNNTTIHVTADERTKWNAKSNFSGNYTDLTGKPKLINKFEYANPDRELLFYYDDGTVAGRVPAPLVNSDGPGYMTPTQMNKLDGIKTGAEVNQNAFTNVKVGTTTIAADNKTDTLEIVAGDAVSLTPDATGDKLTISVSADSTLSSSSTKPVQNKAVYTALQTTDQSIQGAKSDIANIKTAITIDETALNTAIDNALAAVVA